MFHDHDNHSHDHDHPHTHDADAAPDPAKTKALLAYMVHHNEHHADELASLLDSLPERAKKKLSSAIGAFEAANVELREVLACLE